jgi:hypothetical protein
MKGIFWNSIDLRDLAKFSFLHDLFVEKSLDFIAILETHRRNFSDNNLNTFCGGKAFFWHWIPPRGRSVGILLGVNLQLFSIENIHDGSSST